MLENANDQYMSTRPEISRYESEGLHDPVVGDMRIKWEIITNQNLNIMA